MQTLFTRLISVGAFSLFASQALAAPINATLHKDPNCGCCVEYANYLEDNGFNVKMIDHANMTPVKQRLGTAQAASCHTVEIEAMWWKAMCLLQQSTRCSPSSPRSKA